MSLAQLLVFNAAVIILTGGAAMFGAYCGVRRFLRASGPVRSVEVPSVGVVRVDPTGGVGVRVRPPRGQVPPRG